VEFINGMAYRLPERHLHTPLLTEFLDRACLSKLTGLVRRADE